MAFALNPPSIPGLGTTGGFEFYLQNRGSGDRARHRRGGGEVPRQGAPAARAAGRRTTYRAATQQLFVDLDRNKAEVLGVTVAEAFATMQAFFGSQIAGQFSQFSRVWWVILQADANYRMQPSDFDKVFVRSKSGANVPLSALDDHALRRLAEARDALQRFSCGEDLGKPGARLQLRAGDRRDGSGRGMKLPGEFSLRVGRPGAAGEGIGQHVDARHSSSALILVFLLLAAQFEKWTLPIAVVLTVPVAVLGALVMTWLLGLQNDVYFQVGLVTLVGLSAKNAILICEVAIEHVRNGMSAREARARSRRSASARHRHDLACVRLRLRAARDRERSRSQQPARDRYRRDRRHRRIDGGGRDLRAAVLLPAGIDVGAILFEGVDDAE